jgi:dimeric dUTPase (all-alpha-NTP-PPase superfamily)
MSVNRTIRRVSDFKAQRMEAYRYWQSRSAAERMNAIEEVVRGAYFAKGIDLDCRSSNKKLVRVVRPNWKAA